jgi:hypothetical protein
MRPNPGLDPSIAFVRGADHACMLVLICRTICVARCCSFADRYFHCIRLDAARSPCDRRLSFRGLFYIYMCFDRSTGSLTTFNIADQQQNFYTYLRLTFYYYIYFTDYQIGLNQLGIPRKKPIDQWRFHAGTWSAVEASKATLTRTWRRFNPGFASVCMVNNKGSKRRRGREHACKVAR